MIQDHVLFGFLSIVLVLVTGLKVLGLGVQVRTFFGLQDNERLLIRFGCSVLRVSCCGFRDLGFCRLIFVGRPGSRISSFWVCGAVTVCE